MTASSLPPWDPDEYDRRIERERQADKRLRRLPQPLPITPADRKKVLAYPLRQDAEPTRLLGRKKRRKEAD